MPAPTISYMLNHIYAKINRQILELAFEPTKHQTTLDNRILEEVIQSRILLDINLLMGKRTQIELAGEWLQTVGLPEFAITTGSFSDAAYYLIPPEAREMRNIATVQGISNSYSYATPMNAGMVGNLNNSGNTITNLGAAAISSRTEYNYPIMPAATLQSNNLIKVYPNTYSDGLLLECTLEYDSEFTNANQNVIFHLRNLAVCAVKTWIYNQLVIQIDTAEIIGGMAIGAIKERVLAYENADDEYQELLFKVRGGMMMDPDILGPLVSMML